MLFLPLTIADDITNGKADAEKCLYYFYGEDCQECAKVDDLLKGLQQQDPALQVQRYEVYYNTPNQDLLENYFINYKVPVSSQGVPAIFMPGAYFVGQESITSLLFDRLEGLEGVSFGCPSLGQGPIGPVIGLAGKTSPQNALDILTLSVVTKVGFQDGISAGMLALFLIFLIVMVLIRDEEKILTRGSLFLGMVYLLHLSYAMGYWGWFSVHGQLFPKIVSVIALAFGIGILASFFGTWKPFLKPLQPDFLEKAQQLVFFLVSPVAIIILSAATTVWTFSDQERTFTIMRILFADLSTRGDVFPLLLYYLLVMVLPMLFVLIIIYGIRRWLHDYVSHRYQYEVKKSQLWHRHVLRLFNFCIALVMIGIGLKVLF